MRVIFLVYVEQILSLFLFVLISWTCSLYLTLNVVPIGPKYFLGYSWHENWYISLLLNE
jgi:hypothetical protein